MCKPISFFVAPLRKPRTEWGCQPVAFLSSGSETPVGQRGSSSILAVLVPRRAAASGLIGAFVFSADLVAALVLCAVFYCEVVWAVLPRVCCRLVFPICSFAFSLYDGKLPRVHSSLQPSGKASLRIDSEAPFICWMLG